MNECLDIIDGLRDLIASGGYRRVLDLPNEVCEDYVDFAHGEYNQNFLFTHPKTDKKLILRVERGSQMGLKNQIDYEFGALKALEKTCRTPKAIFCDGSRRICEKGVLVEEFLPGVKLAYENPYHLSEAASIFADIHSFEFPVDNSLIKAENAFAEMLRECENMAHIYMVSDIMNPKVKAQIERLLAEANSIVCDGGLEAEHLSIINTEVNNTNFLINEGDEKSYLIDWEKPLIADPAQDIGHFLADTTTFWKTDFFFNADEKQNFVDEYIDKIAGRFIDSNLRARSLKFANFTCLRGITWCAMASVEYAHASKDILDPVTQEKLTHYLDVSYLESVTL